MANEHAETASAIVAKSAPPVTVSIATVMGVQISELVLWATFIYTILMIARLAFKFYQEIRDASSINISKRVD